MNYKLKELIQIKNGSDYKKLNKGDIPVYGTGGVMTYVDDYLCDGESILLPRKGTLNNVMYVNGKFWTVDTMYWTVVNREKVLPQYLYYYLSLLDMSSRDSGSTLPSMTFDAYYTLDIDIPSLDIQQRVINIIDPIDKKIKSNDEINDNLQQQLSCEYQYKFMQNITSLWEKTTLDKIATLYQPQTLSGKELLDNGNYLVYGANGIIGKYNSYNHEKQQIAVACRGASCGALTMTLPKSWITGNAMVVSPKTVFPYQEFLFYTLSLISVSYLVSGSAQPQLTRENMSLYPVVLPSIELLETFENKARVSRNIIISNSLENIQLIKLRDWLLPMFMNGQVTITN